MKLTSLFVVGILSCSLSVSAQVFNRGVRQNIEVTPQERAALTKSIEGSLKNSKVKAPTATPMEVRKSTTVKYPNVRYPYPANNPPIKPSTIKVKARVIVTYRDYQ